MKTFFCFVGMLLLLVLTYFVGFMVGERYMLHKIEGVLDQLQSASSSHAPADPTGRSL